jgi:hypothetical protein
MPSRFTMFLLAVAVVVALWIGPRRPSARRYDIKPW